MRAIFFSQIAHELRTPLNSIIPLLKLLMESLSPGTRAREYADIILSSAYHLENVIDDALDMSRLENNKFSIFKELISIRETVEEVCSIMKFQMLGKGLTLGLSIDPSVPSKVLIDAKCYKQVLFNLLGNAVKFTFRGRVDVSMRFCAGCLVTEVRDSGIGIKPEDLTKLFKFFGCITKSKEINRGGMGLGLTISKLIL